jgi:hypothetical protein
LATRKILQDSGGGSKEAAIHTQKDPTGLWASLQQTNISTDLCSNHRSSPELGEEEEEKEV